MGKAGRKRKAGARRHPSGQIVQGHDRSELRREGEQLRLQTLLTRARHARLDPFEAASQQAESIEGRMYLRGILSEPEADAIHMYRLVRNRYITAIAAPHRVHGGGDRIDGTKAHMISDQEAEVSKRLYNNAREALEQIGQAGCDSIQALVIYDIIPRPEHWPLVQQGAAALVDHFGLMGPLSAYMADDPKRRWLRALL